MSKNFNNYDDFDDLEPAYQKKNQKKQRLAKENVRRKERNRRSKGEDEWGDLYEYEKEFYLEIVEDPPKEEIKEEESHPSSPSLNLVSESPITKDAPVITGDSTTHTIKGNVINFSRVIGMEKIEREHEEKLTYGIKFIFSGSTSQRELSRIAWFNINLAERDRVFKIEQAFWASVQQ